MQFESQVIANPRANAIDAKAPHPAVHSPNALPIRPVRARLSLSDSVRQLLYIVTVHCKVYRLYSNGSKLSEAVRPGAPKIGRLVYAARLRHEQLRLTVFTAQLLELNSDQNLIPPIDSAVIIRINERGMLLCGQEVIVRRGGSKAKCDYYRQTRVCNPFMTE